MVDHFNVLKIQENPNFRRFSSPPSTVHEVDSMRLPVVPVVVVTEPPPAEQEPSLNPVSPKFLFQVGPQIPFPHFWSPLSFSSVWLFLFQRHPLFVKPFRCHIIYLVTKFLYDKFQVLSV